MHFTDFFDQTSISHYKKLHLIFLFNLLLSGILFFTTYLLWQFQSAWYIMPLLGIVMQFLYAYFIWQQQNQFQRQQQHSLAQQQQYEMMFQNINSGLFLLDRNHHLNQQHSRHLNTLLHQSELRGKNMVAALRPFISKTEVPLIERFLQQLFDPTISLHLLQELNPLSHIDLHFTDQNTGTHISKCLSFHFTRIYEQQDITHILVTVNEITLDSQVDNVMPHAIDTHTQFLLSLIYLDTSSLQNIIAQTTKHIEALSYLLKQECSRPEAYKLLIPTLLQHTEQLQQMANQYELTVLCHLLDEFNLQLLDLKQQHYLNRTHFQPLLVLTQRLQNLVHLMEQIDARFEALKQTPQEAHLASEPTNYSMELAWQEDDQLQQWQHDLANIAQHNHKSIHLTCPSHLFQHLPLQLAYKLQDCAWYLIQYAAMYRIEEPLLREHQGKNSLGQITVSFTSTDSQHILNIEDDGQGIDFDAITLYAMDLGWLAENQTSPINSEQLLHCLFEPEFAPLSAINAAKNAQSLYSLRNWLDEKGGQINIQTEKNTWTCVTIKLPKS